MPDAAPPIELRECRYVIFFQSSQASINEHLRGYRPTVNLSEYIAHANEITLPLGLDKCFVSILPALWYCLGLPRSRYDLLRVPASRLKACQVLNVPQRIFLVPLPFPTDMTKNLFDRRPTIVFVEEALREQALSLAGALGPVIALDTIESLSKSSVLDHWTKLHAAFQIEGAPLNKGDYFIQEEALRATWLPTHCTARQLTGGSGLSLPERFESLDELLKYSLDIQATVDALLKIEIEEGKKLSLTDLPRAELEAARHYFRCPIALAIPGVSAKAPTRIAMKLIKKIGIKPNVDDAGVEKSVLDFIAAHRALARGGIGLVAREIADEAFTLLDSLESHWGAGKPKPKFIWKILHEIGKHLSATLTTLQLETLRHASDLTCFAEFPLGLAVLPGDTAPLTCRFPIAYRPIVPLSRAFTSELNDVPIFYLRDRLNVLIVECLSQTDPIGRLSRVGWKQIEQTLKGAPGVRLKVVEATNASEIKAALAEDRWDILTISAHGGQHASENRTGFVCGEELIVEEELGRVPPIVWLSACQIAPRGRGTVNYSDMLFRSGAIAVIGTLVPIDVRHNAILMNRLFANLSETINGRETRFRTLQDMWHFTVTSNAFNDILFGNNSLREWAGDSRHAPSVIIEFMAQRSRGRLRPNHIYDDTIAVLGEIAQNRGVGQKFHSWIASQGFVPESAFYAVLGWPDRIVFHDQLIARLSREMEADK